MLQLLAVKQKKPEPFSAPQYEETVAPPGKTIALVNVAPLGKTIAPVMNATPPGKKIAPAATFLENVEQTAAAGRSAPAFSWRCYQWRSVVGREGSNDDSDHHLVPLYAAAVVAAMPVGTLRDGDDAQQQKSFYLREEVRQAASWSANCSLEASWEGAPATLVAEGSVLQLQQVVVAQQQPRQCLAPMTNRPRAFFVFAWQYCVPESCSSVLE